MIALQHIGIHWTKWERGAEAGAVRAALPRELPFRPADPAADWVHHVGFAADIQGQYQRRDSWAQGLPTRRDGLTVKLVGDVAEVRFQPDHVYQGKVHREHFTGLIARLPFGQRLVIRINSVSDGDHQRYYGEDIFHLGFAATATLDLPLFREIDERVPLY